MTALGITGSWPVPNVSAATLRAGQVTDTVGDIDHRQRLASISKPIAAWAMLVAVEERVIALDTPIGQEGCTLKHLLSHAGGYPFDGMTRSPSQHALVSTRTPDLISRPRQSNTRQIWRLPTISTKPCSSHSG